MVSPILGTVVTEKKAQSLFSRNLLSARGRVSGTKQIKNKSKEKDKYRRQFEIKVSAAK